jgi:hypothetical protein
MKRRLLVFVLLVITFSFLVYSQQTSFAVFKNQQFSDVSFSFFPQKINEPISLNIYIMNPIPSKSYTISFYNNRAGTISTSFQFPPKDDNERDVFESLLKDNIFINRQKYSELTGKVLILYGWNDDHFTLELCLKNNEPLILESFKILAPLRITIGDYSDYYVLYNDFHGRRFVKSNTWHANPIYNTD